VKRLEKPYPPNFAMRLWYAVYRPMMTALFAIIGPVHVYGQENVPREGPIILAPNHLSYLDPPVIGWKVGRYVWPMGKKELFEMPLLGTFFRKVGVICVDQKGPARAAIRAMLEQLEQGRAVLIFPEGTRTRGPLGKAQPGVALIARKSGAPIVPVLVTGTEHSLSWDRPGLHRGLITCTYGKPFHLAPTEKVNLEADAQQIMDAIAALRAVTPDAHPEIREEDLPPPRDAG
jgi:1-acyl-sn-glycerol-3-phosphate acyltransferase